MTKLLNVLVSAGRKAIAAAVFAGVGALGAAMLDGDLTRAEAIIATGTALVAGAGTYAVKPGPAYTPPPRHRAG